ncbi:hypothetical protein PGB90_000364 [Kerria lacca]
MFSLSTVKSFCFSKPTLNVRKDLYFRFLFVKVRCSRIKNDFRSKVYMFTHEFHPRYESFKNSNNVKQHSAKILKTWSQQVEFLLADRIRRSLQLVFLYKKWWGDFMTKLYLRRLTCSILKPKKIWFTACLAPLFTWDKNRINEEEFLRLKNEIDNVKTFIEELSDKNTSENQVKYECSCTCKRCRNLSDNDWSVFYTGRNFKILRKEHVDYPGQELYVYKIYGKFPDVSANDFFRVQLDINYRKEWDPNSIKLHIVESDDESNSDILYWEFLFPRMFYNRDYVCNRRYDIDQDNKQFTIINESIEHPLCPEKPPIHRVKEYWSHIVIRSTSNSLDEPGIEFTILYFDNPELSIQNYIFLYYAIAGMTDYIEKQRNAAKKLSKIRIDLEKKNLESIAENKSKKDTQQSAKKRILLL